MTSRTNALTVAVILMALNFLERAIAAEPDQVVLEYITSFKKKDIEKMLDCLADSFFEEFKSQYFKTVEGYSAEKRAVVLQIFSVESLDQLSAMSGREIFISFLESPLSGSYWKSFDTIDLVAEAEVLEKNDEKASVRSFLSAKGGSGVRVETIYSLKLVDGVWKIERFRKRVTEPK